MLNALTLSVSKTPQQIYQNTSRRKKMNESESGEGWTDIALHCFAKRRATESLRNNRRKGKRQPSETE